MNIKEDSRCALRNVDNLSILDRADFDQNAMKLVEMETCNDVLNDGKMLVRHSEGNAVEIHLRISQPATRRFVRTGDFGINSKRGAPINALGLNASIKMQAECSDLGEIDENNLLNSRFEPGRSANILQCHFNNRFCNCHQTNLIHLHVNFDAWNAKRCCCNNRFNS